MSDRLTGTIFDPAVPAIVKVSRVATATIFATCAALFYMVLAI